MTASPARPPGFSGNWFTDLNTRAAYSEGAGPLRIIPAVVAVPERRDDLATTVEVARKAGLPLTPRGAGSGMPGGNVGPGILVDMGRFSRPLRASAQGAANAPAAVTIDAINEAASHFQMRFPPNPSSSAFCTIGGAISTNAAGPNAVRYGSARRWINGVELVTTDGDVTWLGRGGARRGARTPMSGQRQSIGSVAAAVGRFNEQAAPSIADAADRIRAATPATRKSSAGYALAEYLESRDVLDLVIGAEGTLGFVTRAEVKLATLPGAYATAMFGIADPSGIDDIVTALRALKPSAIEWFDETFLQYTRTELPGAARGALIVEFDRPNEAAARGVLGDAVRHTADHVQFATTALDAEERDRLWGIRRQASATLAGMGTDLRPVQIVEDGCVPDGAVAEYTAAVRAASTATGIEIAMFGHAGDGNIHVNALIDPGHPDIQERMNDLFTRVTDAALSLGGNVSGEHGDGRLRATLIDRCHRETAGLFRLVKDSFDPEGLLNPGVVLPEAGGSPFTYKMGPTAPGIPEYIEEALRAMERERTWSTPKHRLVR